MLGARHLSSLALALCLYHASAFAGLVSTPGARSNVGGGGRANAAMPPRAIDGVDQQLGKEFALLPAVFIVGCC